MICSEVKKEREAFLQAFNIEDVWAEMEKIKENKIKVDELFKKAINPSIRWLLEYKIIFT